MRRSNTQVGQQAKASFDQARQAAEAGDLDRAIELQLEGIRQAPDAVQAGHIELRVLALRRLRQGGGPSGASEASPPVPEGATPLDKLLHAERLLAQDPEHLAYGEAILHAAVEGGYRQYHHDMNTRAAFSSRVNGRAEHSL